MALLGADADLAPVPQTVVVAAFTLAFAVTMQTVMMGIYLRLVEPGQMTLVIERWRPAIVVGLIAMLASACWFTAMAMHNAAMVRALGQIELLFHADDVDLAVEGARLGVKSLGCWSLVY